MITNEMLKTRQALPLDQKINMSKKRIKQWINKFGVNGCYVAFSGGKDSTVLKHLVEQCVKEDWRYRGDIPSVFSNTGLEYPEIVDFVFSQDNVIAVKPKMPFNEVIEKYGYPVISKKVSRYVNDMYPGKNNQVTKNLRLTGINKNGEYCPSMKLSNKWKFLINAPFRCSEKCCDIIKKAPLKEFSKKENRVPFIGVMASESDYRSKEYKKNGCNSFDSKYPSSRPLMSFSDFDIWEYIKKYNIPYSKIYDMGEKRTGCMFCMFGIMYDDNPNRFQRMQKTHPKQWNYCINKLGCGKVLDYINVSYENKQPELEF